MNTVSNPMAHQISDTRGNCAATAQANRIPSCIAFKLEKADYGHTLGKTR